MNPILFPPDATDFAQNGLGSLTGATACVVTEERNGVFELELTYPMDGPRYGDLQVDVIILAQPGDGARPQPFRVYRVAKPLDGLVTAYAEHISYQLSHIPVSPFAAASAPQALAGLKANAAVDCPFDFWTDVEGAGEFAVEVPSSIRSRLGGGRGSVLEVYGGELEFDRHMVKLHAARGRDNGVVIRYGKNLTDLRQEESIASVVTGVYPYWKDGEGNLVQLPEKVLQAAGGFAHPRVIPLDLSGEFDKAPSAAQLREAAQRYMEQSGVGAPRVSLEVSFAALWQTEEYQDAAPLERVRLCDTVTVQFQRLGVNARAKVVRTEYDVLAGRYRSISLGDARGDLADVIAAQGRELLDKPDRGMMHKAIESATGWITGANGGYVVMRKDGDGVPYEILIMDTPDVAAAQKVWRWNQGGLGYSSTGYAGPYATAITQDGAIVADFITAGVLSANLIKAGVLESRNGVTALDMQTGKLLFSLPDSSQLEIWTGGITFCTAEEHKGSFYVNAGGKSVVKADEFILSDNDREVRAFRLHDSGSSSIGADYTDTRRIEIKDRDWNSVGSISELDGGVYISAKTAALTDGVKLMGSGSPRGSFDLTPSNRSYLSTHYVDTEWLYFQGDGYEPREITDGDGRTVTVLARI